MSLGELSSGTALNYDESVVNNFMFPVDRKTPEKTVLYQELRLIERNEGEINVCWKGAHMMLFFMSFVFGSLCTCCIHRLKFMFDTKCVLFPELVTHFTIHRMVYEFFSFKAETQDFEPELPVEYVTTQWADSSVCYLPTYVPLVSGLAGLVWTTMILMCSSGASHNVAGAQRHWRALPIMFLFSLTMSVLCIYSSTITHRGLQALCSKLAEATGSHRCTYTINMATLAYDRRINGVYQASLLSIASAWLHTVCWILSTLLIAARVLLAVDFTLVYVRAQIVGNLDDILQKHEKQMNNFNAESPTPYRSDVDEEDTEVELYSTQSSSRVQWDELHEPKYRSVASSSTLSLVPEEKQRLIDRFVHKLLHNLLKNIDKPRSRSAEETSTSDLMLKGETLLDKQKYTIEKLVDADNADKLAKEFTQKLHEKLAKEFDDFERQIKFDLENKDVKRDIEVADIVVDSNDQLTRSIITEKVEDKDKKNEPEENENASKKKYEKDKDTSVKRSSAVQFYVELDSKRLTDDISGKPKKKKGKTDEVIEKNKPEESNDKNFSSKITENVDDKKIEPEENANAGMKKDEDDNETFVKLYEYSIQFYSKSDSKRLTEEITEEPKKEEDKKDQLIQPNKSGDQYQLRRRSELRILDDPNDDDRTDRTDPEENEERNKDQKKYETNEK